MIGREEWLLAESIENELDQAQDALAKLDDLERYVNYKILNDPEDDRDDLARGALAFYIERALRAIGALADRLGVSSISREVTRARNDRSNLRSTSRPYEGEIHSEALSHARSCFSPLRAMTDAKAITAQTVLRNILSNTAVIVSANKLVPKNESEVRNAVLQVCRYSFPDSIKEVGIPKIIKHYKGDIGVRSLRTMVEFKFVDSKEEMKSALDGVYADMKGYRHHDWDTFYGVFYMTGPFYIQEDVEREFEYVGADRTWTPLVVQGPGKRRSKTSA
jgi:hypothetical protein